MSDRVLCVDDDPNILAAYRRALHRRFQLDTAAGGAEALALLAERGFYAVNIGIPKPIKVFVPMKVGAALPADDWEYLEEPTVE